MVWHQFSTVQFPSHQFVRKVPSVQFGTWGPSASVQFSLVQARLSPLSLQLFGMGRGTVLGPLQQKYQPAWAGRLGGWMIHFAGYAYLLLRDVMWCQSDATSAQNRLPKVRSVQFACLIGSTDSSFSSVRGTVAKSLRSVLSVQFIQFSSRTLPALFDCI